MNSFFALIATTFLKDEVTANLPQVQTYLTYLNQNGIAPGGLGNALKAAVAIEPSIASGFNQFVKDVAGILLAHITAPPATSTTTGGPPSQLVRT